MITVISGTNRPGSKSKIVAQAYSKLLQGQTKEEVNLLDLQDLNSWTITDALYNKGQEMNHLYHLQDQLLIPADKWVIVAPEYNGSFPGILKLFIDTISVRKYKETFKNKKLALVGVADGRGGNLRGLDHLTTSMNYLGLTVFNNRLPISQIGRFLKDDGNLDEVLIDVLENHSSEFIDF